MDRLWTWGGESFGYRHNDRLSTYVGLQAGQFHANEVYGRDGRYLGEIMSKNRLITNLGRKSWVKSSFAPVIRGSYARYLNYVAYVMYLGYEEFPPPDQFRR